MSEVLRIENLTVRYALENKEVRAVEGVSLVVEKGQVLGVVGESGSGKSTLAHAVMRLLPSNAYIKSGRILFDGVDILNISEEELRKIRWRRFSMVFQKSMNALSPVHKVGDQLLEAYMIHHPNSSEEEGIARIRKIFEMVALPERVIKAYPHELSGGMMQRTMIALALINDPEFVIFDEATTALDVVTQGMIIEEIRRLVKELNLTAMVITHDMGVVAELCDRIAVMYAGRLVELGDKESLLNHPLHPYTKALISSIPDLLENGEKLKGIPGTLPDLTFDMKGCVFAPRCPYASEECWKTSPEMIEVNGRFVACLKSGA